MAAQIAPSILSADFARLGRRGGGHRRRRLGARRRHGQPLRAQPDAGAAGRRVAAEAHRPAGGLPPDDRGPGPLGPRFRRGRRPQRHLPRGGGARADPAGPQPAGRGRPGRVGAQAGDARRALRRPAARDRHAARHDRRARASAGRRSSTSSCRRCGAPASSCATASTPCGSRSTAASTSETIERCAEAGADVFVAGSAVYRGDDPASRRTTAAQHRRRRDLRRLVGRP